MNTEIRLPSYAQEVLDQLEQAGYEAYVVGGCVRDSLMGGEPLDWDVCTNATPQQSLKVFARYHCIKTGLQHGTITVMVQKNPVELTTYRLDGSYSDNRRPDSVHFVSDLKEDLARRDFTINAMAYSPSRGLVDCFGGQQDLESKLLRCVGNPTERFHEDGLRILRALRFASRLLFDIDHETTKSIRSCEHLLANVSVERIFKEMKGILVGKGVRSMMLNFPQLFVRICPELKPLIEFEIPHHKAADYSLWEYTAHVIEQLEADEAIRLAALFHAAAKPSTYQEGLNGSASYIGSAAEGAKLVKLSLKGLKCDNATMDLVECLVKESKLNFPTRRAGMRRLIGRLGIERLQKLFTLRQALLRAQFYDGVEAEIKDLQAAQDLMAQVLKLSPCFTVKDLAINGKDLMAMGMQAGPVLREVLEALLAKVQDDALQNECEALKSDSIVQENI